MVTVTARGLLRPSLATATTATGWDTAVATMVDTVTTLARGLLRPSLRLLLPLLPRLMLSPATATTVMATTVTVTVTATTATTLARGRLMLSPATATTVMDTATPTTMVDTTIAVRFRLSDTMCKSSAVEKKNKLFVKTSSIE